MQGKGKAMSLRSSQTRYGRVAVAIHWLTALAILFMLGTGLAASNATNPAAEFGLLRSHAIMGALILVLTLFRILWWLAFDRRPARQVGMSAGQALAASVVHYGLYVVVLILVASGIGTLLYSGANQQLFGGAPLPLPDFTGVPPFGAHALLVRVLIALLIGHIGAALWHQFVRRDRLLARMGVGR
jgi:cytochrome b561